MRRWGILVTTFYFLLVIFLLFPLSEYFAGGDFYGDLSPIKMVRSIADSPEIAFFVSWPVLLIIGQALLISVSVDTARNRLRPRRHIIYSAISVGVAVSVLMTMALWSAVVAIFGEDVIDSNPLGTLFVASVPLLWAFWGYLFYRIENGKSAPLDRAVRWLLRGSILELLVVLPCHVYVRQREDCCAPFLTGSGIATGIAVMLFSFGPSVIFLYKKRMEKYDRSKT